MGPRLPWDEIGLKFPSTEQNELEATLVEIPQTPEHFDFMRDMKYLGQKTLFGAIVSDKWNITL